MNANRRWKASEDARLIISKGRGARHKVIARQLRRTPVSIDRRVAVMKERGLLAMHRAEELDLLERLIAEAHGREMHRDERA